MVGCCSGKNNSDDGEIKISTGLGDVSQLGSILTFDNISSVDTWSTSTSSEAPSDTENVTLSQSEEDNAAEECNAIRGSDGSVFPPFLQQSDTLYIYNKAMCRSLGLQYSVSIEGDCAVL